MKTQLLPLFSQSSRRCLIFIQTRNHASFSYHQSQDLSISKYFVYFWPSVHMVHRTEKQLFIKYFFSLATYSSPSLYSNVALHITESAYIWGNFYSPSYLVLGSLSTSSLLKLDYCVFFKFVNVFNYFWGSSIYQGYKGYEGYKVHMFLKFFTLFLWIILQELEVCIFRDHFLLFPFTTIELLLLSCLWFCSTARE